MWLARPVYELLPYAYMVLGLLLLGGASYISGWATLLIVVGIALLVAGVVLWLKRRDYRRGQTEYNSRSLDE